LSKNNRDEFHPKIVEALGKRASYICSNPDCRALTIAPSDVDLEKFIYIGEAAHITAAAPEGPRHDESLSSEQRCSIENGIFLCKGCARMIDVNQGIDFPEETLRSWKSQHEKWVRSNLNKSPNALVSTVDGVHQAEGKGDVIALDIQTPTLMRPGTKSIAKGEGNITATRIGSRRN